MWSTYNEKVHILLITAAVIVLALAFCQTFGGDYKPGKPKLEWVSGATIISTMIQVSHLSVYF